MRIAECGRILPSPTLFVAVTMSLIKFNRIVLLAVSGLIPTTGWSLAIDVETAATPYQHAVQAAESCANCHEKNRVDVFASSMANNCGECHSSDDDSNIVRVADKKFSDVYADKLKIAPPPEVTAGMSVPM